MTSESNESLITENMDIVKWCIYKHIHVNERVIGLEYDDLYQVGCLALCEAALSYNGSTKFRTYAQVFVRNRLIDHCRKVKRIHDKTCYLENSASDVEESSYSALMASCDSDPQTHVNDDEIARLMQKLKQKYSGVTLKGIQAIELKIKGYSGVEIASLYKVKPNLLAAWISRAKQRLMQDEDFLAAFPDHC